MATPKPGEIRCPTCHRSTPPATFCTQCGTAIPPDARIRPRGLDREELQDRIRARRLGGEPYRRGSSADDGPPGYERFEPEPEDRVARGAGPGAGQPRRDLLRETPPPISHVAAVPAAPIAYEAQERDAPSEWTSPPTQAWSPAPDSSARYDEPVEYADAPSSERGDAPAFPHTGVAADEYRSADEPVEYVDYDDGYAPEYEEWEERRERRSVGAGLLGVVGFLVLGALALVAGAVLAGVFSNGGVGQADVSPSATATAVATSTAEPTPDPTDTPEPSATDEPPASGEPVVFPDGFTAEVQPCLPGTADIDGCDSNGASNSGSVVIWVGFANGTEADVLSAQVVNPDGGVEGTGTIDLARLGCRDTCPGGWTYFPFDGLSPGRYEVRVLRNGEPAGESAFEVS
jgi:hypothetical protein